MAAPLWIFKSENVTLSSLGTTFTHGLYTFTPGGVNATPAGAVGETRIVLRSGSNAIAFVSLSNSITVTVQSVGNGVIADVICQVYHSIIA